MKGYHIVYKDNLVIFFTLKTVLKLLNILLSSKCYQLYLKLPT